MAFNLQTFKTRALTAVIFVVVMLAGLLWNQWSFLFLFSIIHFGCWWEYLRLLEKIYNTNFHIYVRIGLPVMGYGLMLWFCGPAYEWNTYGIRENLALPVSAAGFAVTIIGIFQKQRVQPPAFTAAFLGLFYVSLSWGLMMHLYSGIEFNNPAMRVDGEVMDVLLLPAFVIGCMWINDTMAYIVGSFIGKTPLSRISPKKTWEGTIGGIILSSLAMGYLAWILDESDIFGQSLSWWIVLAATAAVSGTFGDLLESKLKRMADVKDSGSIMPGHGGFLDRFDSLLLATPFVWLYVTLFG